jgi:hypothetical protein
MNKSLLASLLIVVAAIVITPIVLAETVPSNLTGCTISASHALNGTSWTNRGITCPASGACALDSTTYTCATCCLVDKVYTFTDWIFVAVMLFVTIKILQGGYYILTSAGDEKKLTSGRQNILWALAGMAVALFARSLPLAVVALLR